MALSKFLDARNDYAFVRRESRLLNCLALTKPSVLPLVPY